jgi:hypothetical protein
VAIKRRDEVHRMAEANKAFLNFVSNLIICSFFFILATIPNEKKI